MQKEDYRFLLAKRLYTFDELRGKLLDPRRHCLLIDKRTEKKLGEMSIGDLLEKFG